MTRLLVMLALAQSGASRVDAVNRAVDAINSHAGAAVTSHLCSVSSKAKPPANLDEWNALLADPASRPSFENVVVERAEGKGGVRVQWRSALRTMDEPPVISNVTVTRWTKGGKEVELRYEQVSEANRGFHLNLRTWSDAQGPRFLWTHIYRTPLDTGKSPTYQQHSGPNYATPGSPNGPAVDEVRLKRWLEPEKAAKELKSCTEKLSTALRRLAINPVPTEEELATLRAAWRQTK
jgi:hypothetical protein